MRDKEQQSPRTGHVKEISSLANPAIKAIRALALKKNREREQVFLAEGQKLVMDAVEAGWTIRTLLFARADPADPTVENLAARCVAAGGTVLIVSKKILAAVTRRDNPQLVLGVFDQQWLAPIAIAPSQGDVWVALDRVRDPGNLGTIIRTTDAVGAKGIILIGDCTDPYSLETVRATMGSIFSVPIARLGSTAFLEWRRKFDGIVVGTHLDGADDYRAIAYQPGPVLLVMGNEQRGLPEPLVAACDHLARIPQTGRADSLNLAVATAVMLYEIRRSAFPLPHNRGVS